jgi:Leucine-rich repeat (LRR) protein
VIKHYTTLIYLCLFSLNIISQKEFEKFGPYGSILQTDLKEALKTENKVYKLDLSYKNLDPKLLEKLYTLKDLQALKFNTNELIEYPKNFDALTNLVYFATYNNKFKFFPPNLKPFYNLYFLEFQHTKIDSIPAQIAYLNKLQSLKFGNTDDTLKLPNTFQYLKNLKELSIENCILDSFPKQLFKLTNISFLSLSNTNTFYLTKHFERFQNLEVLIIENNHLTTIPFEIYKAQKLRIISLRGNKLTKLPDSISQLENLSLLDIRGNPIDREEIEKLKILLPGCEIKF